MKTKQRRSDGHGLVEYKRATIQAAMGLSAVSVCGISWSYSLIIYEDKTTS